MQQTASMRLTLTQYDITVIYVTYYQMYYYFAFMSLDYRLPNDLHKMRFVDCKFIKPNYISHISVSFSADKVLPCNSQIYYVTIHIIGLSIVLIFSYFLFLRININFY